MEVVEKNLQKAIEDEVHSIFDQDHPHRAEIADHAKTAVKRGSAKAREECK